VHTLPHKCLKFEVAGLYPFYLPMYIIMYYNYKENLTNPLYRMIHDRKFNILRIFSSLYLFRISR
jgi:hypothetical protein